MGKVGGIAQRQLDPCGSRWRARLSRNSEERSFGESVLARLPTGLFPLRRVGIPAQTAAAGCRWRSGWTDSDKVRVILSCAAPDQLESASQKYVQRENHRHGCAGA